MNRMNQRQGPLDMKEKAGEMMEIKVWNWWLSGLSGCWTETYIIGAQTHLDPRFQKNNSYIVHHILIAGFDSGSLLNLYDCWCLRCWHD